MTRFPKSLPLLPAALLATALLALCLGGCSSRINLPTITHDAGGLSYPGKFVWYDLHVPDIDAVARFYDRVFGWSLERADSSSPSVKTILHRGRRIGNIFRLVQDGPARGWLVCVSVPDVDRAAAVAAAQGGAVVRAPADMPFRGRMATIRDPRSARIALLRSSVGDPRDEGPGDGFFLGAELWTTEAEDAARFYAVLAGYRPTPVAGRGEAVFVLVADSRPRGAVAAPPVPVPGPLWIPQVAVLDIGETVRRVEEAGGTVLVRPDPAAKPYRNAVFADPSGSLVGVREFVPPRD